MRTPPAITHVQCVHSASLVTSHRFSYCKRKTGCETGAVAMPLHHLLQYGTVLKQCHYISAITNATMRDSLCHICPVRDEINGAKVGMADCPEKGHSR